MQGSQQGWVASALILTVVSGPMLVAWTPRALFSVSGGMRNVAIGYAAGHDIVDGSDNITVGGGNRAYPDDNGVIRIGTPKYQHRMFVAGVRGVQPGGSGAVPVLIDANGQLGTLNSSRRFKRDITPMSGDISERLLQLRPVSYYYTQAHDDGSQLLEHGLIAEEVAGVFPELVVYDTDGQALTVRYHLLASMLLDALQREHRSNAAQASRLDVLEKQVAALLQGR